MQAADEHNSTHAHLIVLQHGLWGSSSDVSRLTQYLEAVFAEQQQAGETVIVNSKCNERALTYDGVDVCGARLASMIQDKVQQLQEQQNVHVTKLSLIGYSLGGLIIRYAAGKLYVAGFFEQVQPANLITIATPHLGSFKQPTSWLARFFNSQVPIIASRTGMQLMLADADYSVPWLAQQQALHNQAHEEYQQRHAHALQQQHHHQQQQVDDAAKSHKQGDSSSSTKQQQQQVELPPGIDTSQPVPLLLLMAHPAGPFYRALASFTTRIAAANIKHDTTVPYCTAAMCMTNPYEKHPPVPVNPKMYPSVVRPATAAEEAEHPVAVGKGRLYMFLLFLPLFPFFYAYSATKGLLHHRKAKQWPLDTDWLQQYSEALAKGLNPFSMQASMQASRQASKRLQQQQQQQQLAPAAAAAAATAAATAAASETPGQSLQGKDSSHAVRAASSSSSAAAAAAHMLASAAEESPFAVAASIGGLSTVDAAGLHASGAAGKQLQEKARDSRSSSAAGGMPAGPMAASPAAAAAAAAEEGQLQTEDEVLRASGGAVLLSSQFSTQLSRRLSAHQVQEHEGIVAAVEQETWLLQQQQQWMAEQLFDDMPACVVCERRMTSSKRKSEEASSCSSGVASAVAAASGPEAESGECTASSSISTHCGNTEGGAVIQHAGLQQHSTEQSVTNSSNTTSSSSSTETKVFRSKGGWHRVDVWTGHMHAHATIIIRDKRYESQSRDMFGYLVNHMSL